MMMTDGLSSFKNNKYVRMLRHYYDVGLKHNVPEPIVMGGGGSRLVAGIDTLSGPRIHTLLMGFWWTKHPHLPEEVNEEVCRFVFKDPFINTAKIKKLTSVLKQNVFDNATKGEYVDWFARNIGDPLETFQVSPLSEASTMYDGKLYPFNDAEYFKTVASEIRKNLAELTQLGLKNLAAVFSHLLSDKVVVNEDTLSMVCVLNAIESYSGFTRGDHNIAMQTQIAKTETSPTDPGFKRELKNNMDKFLDWADATKAFPNDEEWRARLSSAVTSRSAGGPKVRFEFVYRDKELRLTASDKNLVFTSNPVHWISKEVLESSMTKDKPGGITFRDVIGGRDTRAVWMIHLSVFLYETAWGFALQRWLQMQDGVSFGDVGMESHKEFLYATSRPLLYNVLKDFSQFDASQQWNNVYRWVTKYMSEGLVKRGINHMLGDPEFGGFANVYIAVMNQLKNAIFLAPDGTLVSPDQNHSGKFNTANDNTFANISEDEYEERLLRTKFQALFELIGTKIHGKILGDDSAKIQRAARVVLAADHVTWGEAIGDAAHDCGLFINVQKTVRRTAYYEYLKVIGCYGHSIPQLARLMPFSSENVNTLLDPIEGLRGIASFYRTIVARGGNHEWLHRYMHHVWNIRRGVKKSYVKNQRKKRVTDNFESYPFATIWTPQALGGVGELPWTLVAPSKDIMIYLWAKRVPRLMDAINHAAHVIDAPDDRTTKSIAGAIMDQGLLDNYSEWLTKNESSNQKHLNMMTHRELTKDIKLGELDYEFMVSRKAVRTMERSTRVTEIAKLMKSDRAGLLARNKRKVRKKDFMKNMFGWTDSLEFSFDKEIERVQDVAVTVGRHPSVRRLETHLGFSTVVSDQRRRISKLFHTLADKTFSPEAELGFDNLIKLFTRPEIYADVDVMTSIAIRIGASPDNAVRFASSFTQKLDSALMIEKGQKFSSGSELCNTLNLSYTRIHELVDIPVWITQMDVLYLCRQVGALMILTTPMNEPLRHVIVKSLGDAQGKILSTLLPSTHIRPRVHVDDLLTTKFT
jgi:hypothetical protein